MVYHFFIPKYDRLTGIEMNVYVDIFTVKHYFHELLSSSGMENPL